MKQFALCTTTLLLTLSLSLAAPFGFPAGPEVEKVDEVFDVLLKDNYQAELLLSFGTSSKGSAGHLALSVREGNKEMVYSANFYADRDPAHAKGHYTEKLVPAIEKKEYIYGVASTLSEDASFGLDFGEIFKRSLVGIRIYGLSASQLKGIKNFYRRLNEDYRNKVSNTDYQKGEVIYNYMKLNCAKTVAAALKLGAGYSDIALRGNGLVSSKDFMKYISSHVPTKTTMNILDVLADEGLSFDAILYKKTLVSDFYDEELKAKFKDLPNRFPSYKSLDFFNGSTNYEDRANLRAMYLFYNLGKYSLKIDDDSRQLKFEIKATPKPYAKAYKDAYWESWKKSKGVFRRAVRGLGIKITPGTDTSDLYDFDEEEEVKLFPQKLD